MRKHSVNEAEAGVRNGEQERRAGVSEDVCRTAAASETPDAFVSHTKTWEKGEFEHADK